MSKNYELDGINSNVEYGEGGPRVKNDAGQLQIRNAGDSALATLEIADGSASTDAATKGQVDTLDSGLIKQVTASLAFGTSSPLNIGSALPANSVVIKAMVSVGTAFDGASATVEIGVSGDTDAIQPTTSNDLQSIDLYATDEYYDVGGSSTQMIATYVADGSTVGAAEITLLYFTP